MKNQTPFSRYSFIVLLLLLAFSATAFHNATMKEAKEESDFNVAIDSQAIVYARRSIDVKAPIDSVWKTLTDINEWTGWQSDVAYAHMEENVQDNSQFTWKSGGVKINSTVHTASAPYLLGWTGKAIGTKAIHNWRLESVDGLTRVHVEESMTGWLPSMIKKNLQKSLEQGMQTWLDDLKRQVE